MRSIALGGRDEGLWLCRLALGVLGNEQRGGRNVIPIVCPVRACGARLGVEARRLICAAGHSFDQARSGYFNLLQPQDRKSRQAGDSKLAVMARRRSFARGAGDALKHTLLQEVGKLELPAGAPALDAGSGDGFFADALREGLGMEVCGVDLSVEAIDAAARQYPLPTWIVANADRRMPFADGQFKLVTSITAAKNPSEFRRVLAPDGWLVVVVPGPDDQSELREAVLGRAIETSRASRAEEMFAGQFQLVRVVSSKGTVTLDHEGLVDLFAGAYRGLRDRERAKLDELASLVVTVSHDLVLMRPV